MLSTLYLLKYNNYYNRILKKGNNLGEYQEFIIGSPLTGINFNPNDGITTRQVINWNNDIPDYMLVCNDYNIVSRWFVIESRRLRNGQFELELFRDTLADYLDDLKTAPMFMEKGYCSIDDPAIFNDENITVNSIKDREIELKDPTGCAWVVGYCALKDAEETEPTRIEYGSASDIYDYWSASLEDWDYYKYVNNTNTTPTIKFVDNLNFDFKLNGGSIGETGVSYHLYELKFNKDGKISFDVGTHRGQSLMTVNTRNAAEKIYEKIEPGSSLALYNAAKSYYNLSDDVNVYRQLQQFATTANKTKILKVGTGNTAKYYSIELVASQQSQTNKIPQNNDAMYLAWLTWCQEVGTKTDYKANSFCTNILSRNYYIKLTETTPNTGLEFYFPWGRKALKDAPYCMFALPYGNIDVLYNDNNVGKSFTTNKENALSVAAGLAKGLGRKLYDIQLLPYCPIPAIRNSEYPDMVNFKTAPFSNWTINEHYVLIESARQVMFFCEQSTDSFNIDVSNYSNIFYRFYNSLEFKANMLTSNVRLCSPNYNGVFEFNTYKNRGLSYINVDYTYKPFQPYIHLNPNFGGLYGKDFNDARGLICGGDFSLPITSDAWIEYQLTNKTYQEQFNRRIENMEVQHKYQRIQQIVGVATGTISGTASGAAAGSLYGGGPGAAIGAAVGGAMSLGGGIADIAISDKLRDEAKDYTKDMFSLELENIKALPDSLTKVSAFNANNKIFPFIEYYTCTDREITAVWDKLTYNGFTIGRPDTLQNMINNKPAYLPLGYVKGQLIRLESISDDFHIVNTIASELYKGVYV